jgi:hypothetical protein
MNTKRTVSSSGRQIERENMKKHNLALMISLGLALLGCNRQRSPASVSDIGARMTKLIKQHHFDEAAQLGLASATGKQSDAAIYYFVALAYAERAHYEPATKDEALKLVSEYSGRSIELDQGNRANRFNISWVLEYAGDVDSSSRCKFFADSQQLMKEMASQVSGDAALRNEITVSTSRISEKVKATRCG